MRDLERLWQELRLPIRDALHFANGDSYDVTLASDKSSGWKVLAPFGVGDMLASEPDWTSSVDGLISMELGQGGALWGGDGAYGSEGFVARLAPDRSLIWAIFFMESNPFEEIQLFDEIATFTSTSGIKVTVDINDPRNPVAVNG
ncbi:hypothetical protein [Streptomyces sparsogenes]|uniref:hypothetical protein n=1 Tax=Streptomyces sparsogenes TaxID=67365 RepID=UPI000978FC69|nr:hypothetical protein [Streptomyces sparsogenes]